MTIHLEERSISETIVFASTMGNRFLNFTRHRKEEFRKSLKRQYAAASVPDIIHQSFSDGAPLRFRNVVRVHQNIRVQQPIFRHGATLPVFCSVICPSESHFAASSSGAG
jgi:hypothetical protein